MHKALMNNITFSALGFVIRRLIVIIGKTILYYQY